MYDAICLCADVYMYVYMPITVYMSAYASYLHVDTYMLTNKCTDTSVVHTTGTEQLQANPPMVGQRHCHWKYT